MVVSGTELIVKAIREGMADTDKFSDVDFLGSVEVVSHVRPGRLRHVVCIVLPSIGQVKMKHFAASHFLMLFLAKPFLFERG